MSYLDCRIHYFPLEKCVMQDARRFLTSEPSRSPTTKNPFCRANALMTNCGKYNYRHRFSVHDASTKHVIKFLHQCLFPPTKSTLLQALDNNHFVGWSTLTRQNVICHLGLELSTILGHMDQQSQGTRSTHKITPVPLTPLDSTGTTPKLIATDPDLNVKTKFAYLSVQDLSSGRIITDQIGSFPVVSSQGTKAVMLLYDYDSNSILVKGITSRNQNELVRAYTLLVDRLTIPGVRPFIQRMDNEVSALFKLFLRRRGIALELTPAHVHRRNAAERAIRT